MAITMTYTLLIIAALFVLFLFSRRRTKCLPPGPKGHPLISNLLGLAQDREDTDTFLKWREDYGSIMHMGGLGNHMIVLNTAQAASDLMDKRAAIYSNRPRMVMLEELVGNGWQLGLASGELHREQRSLAQRYFLMQIKDWQIIQLESARTLLRNLFAHPNDWAAFIRMSVASSVLRICYGHEITHPDDHLLRIASDALNSSLSNAPYLVDVIPLLKYYPSWLPGGGFQRDAMEARVKSQRLRYTPFNIVRSQMAAGKANPSFIATLLNSLTPDENIEHLRQAELIRDAAAGIYLAAMHSTVSSMYTFIGAMVLHPDIQRRAQSELDSVLSQGRLPTFEDRPSLPFIDCIVLEVLRFNVVAPLGVPHTVTKEDEYLGYQIPKGSTILGNIWAILRDPEAFPNPEQFDPSRFLVTTNGSAKAREIIESVVFGWGRRTCPGRHVGQSTLFISFSHILTCFDITKPVDDEGNEFEPSLKFRRSLLFVRCALPIPCTIKPRSDKFASLLARPE